MISLVRGRNKASAVVAGRRVAQDLIAGQVWLNQNPLVRLPAFGRWPFCAGVDLVSDPVRRRKRRAWPRPRTSAKSSQTAAAAGLEQRSYRYRDPKTDAQTDYDPEVDVHAIQPQPMLLRRNGLGNFCRPTSRRTDGRQPGARRTRMVDCLVLALMGRRAPFWPAERISEIISGRAMRPDR